MKDPVELGNASSKRTWPVSQWMEKDLIYDHTRPQAKMSKICLELTPVWNEGEAALRSPWHHQRRATCG